MQDSKSERVGSVVGGVIGENLSVLQNCHDAIKGSHLLCLACCCDFPAASVYQFWTVHDIRFVKNWVITVVN